MGLRYSTPSGACLMTPEAFAYKTLLTSHEPKFSRLPLTFRPKNKFPSNFGKFLKDTVKNLKLHRYSLVATRISRTAFLYKDMRMLSSTTLPQSLQTSTSTPPVARKRGKQARKISIAKESLIKFLEIKIRLSLAIDILFGNHGCIKSG